MPTKSGHGAAGRATRLVGAVTASDHLSLVCQKGKQAWVAGHSRAVAAPRVPSARIRPRFQLDGWRCSGKGPRCASVEGCEAGGEREGDRHQGKGVWAAQILPKDGWLADWQARPQS